MGLTYQNIIPNEVSELADQLWQARNDALTGTEFEKYAYDSPKTFQRDLYLDLALWVLENFERKGDVEYPVWIEDEEGDFWHLNSDRQTYRFESSGGHWGQLLTNETYEDIVNVYGISQEVYA